MHSPDNYIKYTGLVHESPPLHVEWEKCDGAVVNPRCACAERVIVLGLCVCVCVCVSVRFLYSAISRI